MINFNLLAFKLGSTICMNEIYNCMIVI